jgi:uncharacterized protein YdeI (YjbR/CyaY-like superfamily)
MSNTDPRMDAYIAKSADFAKPILSHLRKLVHDACPEVQETMKWSFPHFDYRGILCSMAAFTQHCAFGFWKSALILGKCDHQVEAMGQFGRITSIADLPKDKVLLDYLKEAIRLNEQAVKAPARSRPKEMKRLVVPKDLLAALKRNRKADETFNGFSCSHKKEYVEWITEAKRDETRAKRLAQTIEWLAEGKSRNWKYERC